jgi:hypothetical protein
MADSSLNFRNTNSPSNDLKAGMYGTAVLLQNNKRIYDGRGAKCFCRKRSNQIFVVQNGIAKLKNVTAGRILGDKVEILDGLSNNEIIIVTGQINLDGTKVDIIK